jgi:hypothetical protein
MWHAYNMRKRIELPEISAEERTPLVRGLLEIIEQLAEQVHGQEEEIGRLKDEIAVLKGEKKRPRFKPSKLEEQAGKEQGERRGKRPGSEKRGKTPELEIHEERIIAPVEIPEGSRFKGYQDYVVQELVIRAHNTRYRLERWQTPQGESLIGRLPESVEGHFGPILVSYIVYQHHHAQVTQPLLREQLQEWGIEISAGQIDALLSSNKEDFFEEKGELLRAGLETSRYITVDDTGARHQGKNGYATHIGNEFFAWFQSTEHKSRINFLEMLRAGSTHYRVDEDALAYMHAQKLPRWAVEQLGQHPERVFADLELWQGHLKRVGITQERHRRIATEGALLGSVLHHGCPEDLAIVSDDAGQFNVLCHGLCWVHAERLIHKLIPLNDTHRVELHSVRGQIWDLYAELKDYKTQPSAVKKAELEARFEEIFTTQTSFATLNATLTRLHRHKAELLLVLERPEVPLHTNGSERDIREYVRKRKVSGGTRSELGRRCRDTFISLKKTCRKLGISFWKYLTDRLSGSHEIPPLPTIIRQQATPQ